MVVHQTIQLAFRTNFAALIIRNAFKDLGFVTEQLIVPINRMNHQLVNSSLANRENLLVKTSVAFHKNFVAITMMTVVTILMKNLVASTNAHPICGLAPNQDTAYPIGNFAMGMLIAQMPRTKRLVLTICAQVWVANLDADHHQQEAYALAHKVINWMSGSNEIAMM